MAKKDLVVNIDSKTRGLEQGVSKSVNEVRKLEQQTRKSKNEFKQFDDRVGKLASGNLKGLLGTMGNVAGILGVAKLAQEGFTKTMRASQTTSDAFDVVMGQVTTSVDYFFTALSTGNFENFFSGMASAIAYSKDLTEALDALGDMRLADRFFKPEDNYFLSRNRAIINAPEGEYTKEEKEAALRENESIIEEMGKRAEKISLKAFESRLSAFQKMTASTGRGNYYEERLGKLLEEQMEETLRMKREIEEGPGTQSEKDSLISKLPNIKNIDKYQSNKDEFIKNFVKLIDDIDADKEIRELFQKVYTGLDDGYLEYEEKVKEQKGIIQDNQPFLLDYIFNKKENRPDKEKLEKAQKDLEKLYDDNPDYYRLASFKDVIGDDEIEKLVKLNEEEWSSLTAIEDLRNTQNRLVKRVQNEFKGGGDKEKPQEGSIGYIDEQIKNLDKEFKLAINEEDRKRIKTQLEELEAEKAKLELKVEVTMPEGSLSAINEKISKLNAKLSLEVNEESRIEIWKEIKELEEKKLEIEVGYKQEVVPTPIEGVRDTMFDYNKTTADKLNESLQIKNSYISELRKETELFADELARAEKEASSLQDQLNFQYVKDDLKNFNKALTDSYMDVYSQTLNIASAFTQLSNSFKNLTDVDNTASQWEKLLSVFSAVGSVIQSLVNTFELYNRVEGIISKITAAKQVEMALDGTKAANEIAGITALTTAKVTASGTEAAAAVASNTAITASLIPLISAATTLMAAESTAAYAMIPFTGVGLAATQITAMQGLIATASIPKFAEGGIVYGNTLAQVGEYSGVSNNPEVIAPLSKLKDILSNTQQNGVGGDVKFRIEGKDLMGVLNTHNQINRRR